MNMWLLHCCHSNQWAVYEQQMAITIALDITPAGPPWFTGSVPHLGYESFGERFIIQLLRMALSETWVPKMMVNHQIPCSNCHVQGSHIFRQIHTVFQKKLHKTARSDLMNHHLSLS